MGLQLAMYTDHQHLLLENHGSVIFLGAGGGIDRPYCFLACDAPTCLYKFILKNNLFIKNSKIFQKM